MVALAAIDARIRDVSAFHGRVMDYQSDGGALEQGMNDAAVLITHRRDGWLPQVDAGSVARVTTDFNSCSRALIFRPCDEFDSR